MNYMNLLNRIKNNLNINSHIEQKNIAITQSYHKNKVENFIYIETDKTRIKIAQFTLLVKNWNIANYIVLDQSYNYLSDILLNLKDNKTKILSFEHFSKIDIYEVTK